MYTIHNLVTGKKYIVDIAWARFIVNRHNNVIDTAQRDIVYKFVSPKKDCKWL